MSFEVEPDQGLQGERVNTVSQNARSFVKINMSLCLTKYHAMNKYPLLN